MRAWRQVVSTDASVWNHRWRAAALSVTGWVVGYTVAFLFLPHVLPAADESSAVLRIASVAVGLAGIFAGAVVAALVD